MQPVERCVIDDVDLTALAMGYPHRRLSESARLRALRAIDGVQPGSVVFDVGGGPGDHTEVFRSRDMRAVVVDPSLAMVTSTRAAHMAVCARAEQMPFADSVAALAYFHLSLHYCDVDVAITEAARVLEPSGRIVVWTLSPAHHSSSFLNRWFPTVGRVDAERFASPEVIAERLEAAGYTGVEMVRDREPCVRSCSDLEASVRAGFVSSLQYVSSSELAAGLADFRREYPDPTEMIEYTLDMTMIGARRNGE